MGTQFLRNLTCLGRGVHPIRGEERKKLEKGSIPKRSRRDQGRKSRHDCERLNFKEEADRKNEPHFRWSTFLGQLGAPMSGPRGKDPTNMRGSTLCLNGRSNPNAHSPPRGIFYQIDFHP
ncbi:hypothetical protein ACLOJK_012696 [Asimina triloba]